jgi:very-short-patch-repair endonuclease/predicted transcriptional regulator of viral defense system
VAAENTGERRLCQPYADKVDARVARIAARSIGIVSLAELQACGLSRDAVHKRVAAGHLHVIHRGVFAVGHRGLTHEARIVAAVKACGPTAVASHRAAAYLYELIEDVPRPEVTVLGSGTRLHRGVRVHRTSSLDDLDRRRWRGIPVTSPARTLLDCAAVVPERRLRRLVREAFAKRLVRLDELVEILRRMAPRRGSRRLAVVVASGYTPTRSVLEDVVLDVIVRGGLARPDVNVALQLGGRSVVPDFRWPESRLVVEADGRAFHDHKIAREDDAERQALLESHGERVLRVTWEQAMRRPEQTVARLRAADAPEA